MNSGNVGRGKRLVLVGAGYSNLQVLRLLSGSDAFDSIILIDTNSESIYYGSIPENISKRGLRDARTAPEWRIDLKVLCAIHNKRNNIQFLQGKVRDIIFHSQVIQVEQQHDHEAAAMAETTTTEIPYDLISMDIGSKSKSIKEIPGAYERAIPTRPMKVFMDRLEEVEKSFSHGSANISNDKQPTAAPQDTEAPLNPLNVAVVGGGASGIELALSIVGRWKPMLGDRPLHVSLITSETILLPEIPTARKRLKDILVDRGVYMIFHATVNRVDENCLHLESGMSVPFSHCIWATGPGAHILTRNLQRRGLQVTDDGWIEVTPTLQSPSHPNVFAAGDCSSFVNPLPKAGIFALQEGPILAENLERFARDRTLVPFEPDMDDLQFLNCGDGTAMGFAFGLVLRGEWVFEVKQAMDRHHFLSLTGETSKPSQPNSEVFKQIGRIPTSQAAKMLTQIDVDNYQEAWAILERMSLDKDYRLKVMKDYNHIHATELRESEKEKRQKKQHQLQQQDQFPPLQFLNWLLHAKSS